MAERFHYSPLPIKGVQIDCRAQLMRPERILSILPDLARWGLNTILVEYFDKFPYEGRLRKAVAPDAFTRGQVRELVRTATDLGLQVIPLVQCCGHMGWVLRHASFRHLAEGSGRNRGIHSLCPADPGSAKLFREMAEQVIEVHGGCRYFHMGGDEVELADDCLRCRDRKKAEGVSRLLVDHYIACADWLRSHGPDPILWCDMPLRHPEALDLLRGHTIIMDWDYWSGLKPRRDRAHAWGIPRENVFKPERWPAAHRELFRSYFFAEDGKSARPFPYTKCLRDRGFQVIVAPAIRSYGDSFCVPKALSVENCIGAARTASEAHVLGCIITSWALRRAPWPLTEYSLMAGAMTMANPLVSRREIDARFADEHFGVADPKLAQIPLLLGVNCAGGMLGSLNDLDPRTGHWFGIDYTRRVEWAKSDPNALQSFADLKKNLHKAARLLSRARPKTPRQQERMRFWLWAHDVLAHFAEFGPQVLEEPGTHDPKLLRRFRKRAVALQAKTDRLLRPLLTDHTMVSEHQIRFGIHLDWIDAMITAAAPRDPVRDPEGQTGRARRTHRSHTI